MLVFLLIFSTNIHLTQSKPCSKRSVHQICSAPLECPTQFRQLRNTCARNPAVGQLEEPTPEIGQLEEPTPEILTSTVSSGVVTFPSVTYPDSNDVTENPENDCRRSGCQEPKVCDRKRAECSCPNFCKSLYPPMDLICGSDCRVYFNTCHFETQQCYTTPGVLTMFRRGFCPPRMNPRVKVTVRDNNKANVSASRGTTVSLTCHVSSSQRHAITWQHNDYGGNIYTFSHQQVVTSTTVHKKVTSVSVLELPDFSESQVGDYTCKAVMCDVEESQTITLEEKKIYPVCSILSASLVSSFDGFVYRSRFQGDFILAMDRQNSRWYVLGRFKPCFESGSDYCLHSVTVHDSVRGMSVYRGYRIHGDRLWQVLEIGDVVSREFKTAYRLGSRTVIVLYGGDVVVEWDNMMGVHVTVFRDLRVKTGGLCGNNDRNSENDLLPRYEHYSATDFEDYLRSWRISNHKNDPMGGIPIVERDVLLNEHSENLENCQRVIRELLLILECVPENDKLELLVRVCVYERQLGKNFTDRRRCDVRCYMTEQLGIMCNPAMGAEVLL